MEGSPNQKFNSPEEEIAFLRAQIAQREQAMRTQQESPGPAFEQAAAETVSEYGKQAAHEVLEDTHVLDEAAVANAAESLAHAGNKTAEILSLAEEKGIRNALSVLEKMDDAFLTDDVHRALVAALREGRQIADLKEGMPVWNILHMTLFEVTLPDQKEEGYETQLATLMSAMEQFYAGMQAIGDAKKPTHYTLEIAVSDKQDDIIFYVAVPTAYVNLFEKQILSLFPDAILYEQQNDYNIFTEGGESVVSVAELKKHPIYPIRAHDSFQNDPLSVLLNAFSKIERDGGAALQLVVRVGGAEYYKTYEGIIKRVKDGMKVDVAIRKSTLGGELYESMRELFSSQKKDETKTPEIDTDAIELFNKKLDAPIVNTNIRIAVSAQNASRADSILREIEASFSQFESTKGNKITFKRLAGSQKKQELRAFSFREYLKKRALPLSFAEMVTLMHFPQSGVQSPQFKQSKAATAPAPLNLPRSGTLLGENTYRNVTTQVYITPEDRLRHFYIIGQTGTGKTTLMKNMIAQDIREGNGVCMIDPHGSDIEDVLSAIPDERLDDVIYFDPSRTDRVMGLNMLEYDPAHPEQKTFVVNELFSIFQRLYGANPESMGPMFEQYFRNATQLVLEDPESGSTLLDISRVMADASYRRMKLSKAKNPVVVQFWSEIASKAGGEAALENIVPYITSKFDVFTANDYMRPIIGQQKSSFNFREIMDQKKILLVNLSKGRLGELNANLIGMIIIGKILMAALSRVDDPTKGFPPFYLHLDEFQNVTTDSIAAILSEARKYKLGLTVAHQFIAQLDEKIKNAVFGNVGSIATFRVGPDDSEFLSHQFEPTFSANDLMNIENRHAYVRILADGTPTKPFSIKTMPPPESNPARIGAAIERSYEKYGSSRRKVEMEISARYRKDEVLK